MFKVLELVVENVKKIKFARIQALGNSIIISGANDQGKSTLIDCIKYAIEGNASFSDQTEIIRKGKNNASILVETPEYSISRTFTGKSSYLTVRGKDGAVLKSPQSLMDKFTMDFTIDPLEFDTWEIPEQIAALKKMLGIEEKLKEINNRISALAAKRTPLISKYNLLNGTLKAKKLPEVNLPDQEIDVLELVKIRDDFNETHNKITELNNTYTSNNKDIEEANKSISEYEEKIALLEKTIELKKLQNQNCIDLRNRLVESEIYRVDIDKIKNDINSASTKNEAIRYRNQYASLENELGEIGAQRDELTQDIEEEKRAIDTLMESVVLPIPELTWDDNGLRYRGTPYKQLSTSSRITISTLLAIHSNPNSKVLLIKHGNDLDDQNFDRLIKIAEKYDMQLWIERIYSNDAVPTIVIEDGEIKGEEVNEQT